jgi:hypothetical protein
MAGCRGNLGHEDLKERRASGRVQLMHSRLPSVTVHNISARDDEIEMGAAMSEMRGWKGGKVRSEKLRHRASFGSPRSFQG